MKITPEINCFFLTGGVINSLVIEHQTQLYYCMVHESELPLHHTLAATDAKMILPRCFNITIGKQLQGFEHWRPWISILLHVTYSLTSATETSAPGKDVNNTLAAFLGKLEL